MESRGGLLHALGVEVKGARPFGVYCAGVQRAYEKKLPQCRRDPAQCELLEHARAVLTHDEAYELYQQIWCGANLYTVLDLRPGCDSAEIKRAYRKMMMRAHVDKRPYSCTRLKHQAHLDSQRVGRAYDVLSNHRALYDQKKSFDYNPLDGDDGDDDSEGPGFHFDPNAWAASGSEAEEMPAGYDAEREEAGRKRRRKAPGRKGGRQKRPRGRAGKGRGPSKDARPPPTASGPQQVQLSCTLRDLYRGCRRRFSFAKGFKLSDGEWFNRTTTMDLHIPERTPPGTFQILKAYGQYSHSTGCCDDLEVVLDVSGTSGFRCEGSDLVTTVDVKIETALTGGTFAVTLPDGSESGCEFTDMLRTGDVRVIPEKGLRLTGNGFGSLKCEVRVVYGDWTTQQRKALGAFLAGIRSDDPAVQSEMVRRVCVNNDIANVFSF